MSLVILYALGTAFFFGLNPLLLKKGLDAGGGITKGTLSLLISHLVTMLFLVILLEDIKFILSLGSNNVIWLCLAGISNFALAFTCYSKSIHILGPSRTASIANINPSISVILAVLFLGEEIASGAWIGIITILLGAYLVGKD